MCGIPMLAYPGFADQHENAEWIEKLGVGMALPDVAMEPEGRLVKRNELL